MITDMDENNGSGGKRLLLRPREGRLVAGVCAGLADYLKRKASSSSVGRQGLEP